MNSNSVEANEAVETVTNPVEAWLRAYFDGRIKFDVFALKTKDQWARLAAKLHRRWKASGVDQEDLAQELLIAGSFLVYKWDPTKVDKHGKPVGLWRFVRYNAMDWGKKWLHEQRSAYRRDDKSPGRYDIPLSDMNLERDQADWLGERLGCYDDDPGESIDARRKLLAYANAPKNPIERLVRAQFVLRGLDATEELAESPTFQSLVRRRNPDSARKIIRRALAVA